MVPSATEAALGGGGIRFCTSRLGPGPGRLRLGQQSRGCCGWTSGPRTPGLLKRKVPWAWPGKQAWRAGSLRGHGQAACVSLPAPWPRVLPPASRVLCRPEGWWEGRAPVPPCSSCKASSLLRHGGSRQPFSRVHDGRRPGVRRSARARSWLSRGKAEPRSAAAASGPAGGACVAAVS